MDSNRFIDNNTIASKVTNRLRDDIVAKRIGIGSRITIKDIAIRYGVSEMPVREAFRTLEGESLLEIFPYKGATVLQLDGVFVKETYEILGALECLLYETALNNLDDAKVLAIRSINDEIHSLIKKRDCKAYTDVNIRFHAEIMKYGNNKKAYDYYQYQHKLIDTLRRNYHPNIERIERAARQHDELVEALIDADMNRIRYVTTNHLSDACENLLQLMKMT